MPALVDVKDTITKLSLDLEKLGNEVNAGTKSVSVATLEHDRIHADLTAAQAEWKMLTDFEESRKSIRSLLGDGGAPPDDKNAERILSEHEIMNRREAAIKSLGEQWTSSKAYKDHTETGRKGWSDSVEIKTTLGEGTGLPGNAAVVTPTVLPGVTSLLFAQLTVADLLPSGSIDMPNLRYIVETAVTNAAATVAESGTKPVSDLTLGVVDDRLRKIATLLQVTDEMLSDVSFIQSYIDNRLTLFVKIAEETQLLLGDGSGENLTGLMNRAGKQTTIVKGTTPSLSSDNDMDVVLRMITAIRVGSFLEPDAVIIDPASWQNIQIAKAVAGTGNYFAGGPFGAAPDSLWGKRVVVTPRMTAGAALVGAFQQATQVFRKGGIVVDAGPQHSTNFAINQVTMRAEERLLLAVYRPGALGVVTGL